MKQPQTLEPTASFRLGELTVELTAFAPDVLRLRLHNAPLSLTPALSR